MTSCKADVHFISTFDTTLVRWVPVMISIVFGRTKETYQEIFQCLLDKFSENLFSWEDFTSSFPGCTMDWSQAEGAGFKLALAKHAKEKFGKDMSASDMHSYLRKCEVHFIRSLNRVRDNARVVPPEKVGLFVNLVNAMRDKLATFDEFTDVVRKLTSLFPEVTKWVAWYLTPANAQHFFPACQKEFSPDELQRFNKLHSSTNAEENVGRQFKHLFCDSTPSQLQLLVVRLHNPFLWLCWAWDCVQRACVFEPCSSDCKITLRYCWPCQVQKIDSSRTLQRLP